MTKMMGVDVGQVRVGVALSDPAGCLAMPWRTLMRDKNHLNDIEILVDTIVQRNVAEVYVGLPTTLAGRQGRAAVDAQAYARQIVTLLRHRQVEIRSVGGKGLARICMLDERMTTVAAHRILHANGKKMKQHRKIVDQVAAQEILQHAIESKRHQGDNVGIVVRVEI